MRPWFSLLKGWEHHSMHYVTIALPRRQHWHGVLIWSDTTWVDPNFTAMFWFQSRLWNRAVFPPRKSHPQERVGGWLVSRIQFFSALLPLSVCCGSSVSVPHIFAQSLDEFQYLVVLGNPVIVNCVTNVDPWHILATIIKVLWCSYKPLLLSEYSYYTL